MSAFRGYTFTEKDLVEKGVRVSEASL